MFSPQNNIYYKNTIRVAFIYIIFHIVVFLLLIVTNILSFQFKILTEIIPEDIYITGIISFDFAKDSYNIRYIPGISNLGNTSLVRVDCYRGLCQKRRGYDYNNQNSYISYYNYFSSKIEEFTTKNNNNKIKRKIISFYEDDDEDGEYVDYFNFNCAKECFTKQEKYCYVCPNEYDSSEGKCQFYSNDYYDSRKYCLANHLILKWKGHLYSRVNATYYQKYSYIKSAILPNESCPTNTKLCGFLDDYGNKLCISKYEDCPINKIVISDIMPYDGYHYNYIKFNNITIYYTNEANETGKIIEGFFADSDYFIQYKNGCEIVDEGTIEELIKDNRKIYPNYKKKTGIEKSYLKICNYGHDRKINLIEWRKLSEEYTKNKDLNEKVINKIRDGNLITSIFGYLVFIVYGAILFLIIYPILFKEKENDNDSNLIIVNRMGLFFFIFFGGWTIIFSILFDGRLKDLKYEIRENKDYFNWNIYSALVKVNKAFYIIYIIYMSLVIISRLVYYIIICKNKCIRIHHK